MTVPGSTKIGLNGRIIETRDGELTEFAARASLSPNGLVIIIQYRDGEDLTEMRVTRLNRTSYLWSGVACINGYPPRLQVIMRTVVFASRPIIVLEGEWIQPMSTHPCKHYLQAFMRWELWNGEVDPFRQPLRRKGVRPKPDLAAKRRGRTKRTAR